MKDKSVGIDILKVISMICVVMLHSVSNGLRMDIGSDTWRTINILSSFGTCAVPVFFMISGCLILNSPHTYSLKYTLFNRLPRLIIPLFVWSVIYIIIAANMDFYNRNIPIEGEEIRKSICAFFSKESAVHFWFMYYLIPLYLISPFIKSACDNSNEKIIKYILSLWGILLVLNSVVRFVPADYKALCDIAFIKNIGFVGGYGGYFLMGWYFGRKKFNVNKILYVAVILIWVLIISKGTSYYTGLTGEYNEWLKSYNSIGVCILSISVFMLLKDIKIQNGRKVIRLLSSASYGVYLCHNIFLYLVTELKLGRLTGVEMLRNFIGVWVISLVLIIILSKIKYINYIFTGISRK